jgi:hypothetical protein
MKPVFADAFFFLALMNKRDASHASAVELVDRIFGTIVTTQWILVEVADAFSHPRDRGLFAMLLKLIESDDRIYVVSASKTLFDRGVTLYLNRQDKDWSLTDCISFVVMEARHIKDALTGDHHFEQAGFTVLLPR